MNTGAVSSQSTKECCMIHFRPSPAVTSNQVSLGQGLCVIRVHVSYALRPTNLCILVAVQRSYPIICSGNIFEKCFLLTILIQKKNTNTAIIINSSCSGLLS